MLDSRPSWPVFPAKSHRAGPAIRAGDCVAAVATSPFAGSPATRAARDRQGTRGADPPPRRADARDVPALGISGRAADRAVPRDRRARAAPARARLDARRRRRARRAPTTCDCGAPVPWGSHFCANCGRPVGARPGRRLRGVRPSASRRRELLRQLRPIRRARRRRARWSGRARAGAGAPTRTRRSSTPQASARRSLGAVGLGAQQEERRCPRCGTPYGDGQEYCLECGAATAGQHRRRRLPRIRLAPRLGWYPGDWIWPTLLALLVAVASRRRLGDLARRPLELGERDGRSNLPGATSVNETTTAPEPTTTEPTVTATTAPNRHLPRPRRRSSPGRRRRAAGRSSSTRCPA